MVGVLEPSLEETIGRSEELVRSRGDDEWEGVRDEEDGRARIAARTALDREMASGSSKKAGRECETGRGLARIERCCELEGEEGE